MVRRVDWWSLAPVVAVIAILPAGVVTDNVTQGTASNGTMNGDKNSTFGGDSQPPDTVDLYVQFRDEQGKNAILSATGLVGSLSSESTRYQAGSIKVQDPDYKQLISKLENNPGVEHVEIDYVMKTFSRSGRRLQEVDESELTYGIRMVRAPEVWEVMKNLEPQPTEEEKMTICVVDTGYDLGHEDLPNESHGIDGWNPSRPSFGVWNVDGDSHGTHCAGSIGAIGGNGRGVVGVNPNPSDFRFFIGKGLSDNGFGTNSNVMAAVEACADAGAKVISMSLGGGGFSSIANGIFKQLYDDGILVVAAAGNEGDSSKSYPASYNHVMSVAAVNENGNRAGFSQFNNQVEIAGPGVDVRSTVPNNNYDFFSGTSMATPHVAGVAALIWSLFPACSNHQIRNALLRSAQDPPGSAPCNNRYGYGIVDAKAAYDLLSQQGCEGAGGPNPSPLSNGSFGGCRQLPQDEALPTPSPTMAPECPTNTLEFQLQITTDNYPGETTWALRDKDSNMLESGGPYNEAATILERSACLDVALEPFTFTIFDSYQDGLCCGHGSGSYRVLYNDVEVGNGGTFAASETITFPELLSTPAPSPAPMATTDPPTRAPVPSPPSSSPTAAPQTPAPVVSTPVSCTDPNKEFELKLKTDARPEETTWELTVGPSGGPAGTRVASGGPFAEPRTIYRETLCLTPPPEPNHVYRFVIRDINGLRVKPRGRYEIFLNGQRLRRRNRFAIMEVVDFFPPQCFGHDEGSCDRLSRKFVCCTKKCRAGRCFVRRRDRNRNGRQI